MDQKTSVLNFIHATVVIALALLHHGQANAGNNSGQAFSFWPDTGQTTCYDSAGTILDPCPSPGQHFYGQDAQYSGLIRSYTKLDASGHPLPDSAPSWAMVQDNVTGLIWEAKQAKDSVQNYTNPHDADNTYTWCDTNPDTNGGNEGICGTNDTEDFITALNGSTFGGHTDWRLPTIHELVTLVDRGRYNPATDPTYLPLTARLSYYFSSTTAALGNFYKWLVSFLEGKKYDYIENEYSRFARAVRGNQAQSAENRFVDNQDGTVTDTVTCLQWQQATADITGDGIGDSMNWQSGLAYAENLILAGHTDWRLPDINELSSIVDYSRISPAIDTTAFPDTGSSASSYYLSSTTYEHYPNNGWYIDFSCGEDEGVDKSESYLVRVVRGEQCKYWVITASAGENGSISPSDAVSVIQGGDQSFTITPSVNYHVADVLVDGVSLGAVTSYAFTNVTTTHSIAATFAINQYTISASAGANGSLDAGTPSPQTVNHGATTQFAFNADAGYHVADIAGCGVSYSNTNSAVANYTATTGIITGDCSIFATFAINQYMLSSSTGANGMISPLGTIVVNHGSEHEYIITPNANYQVADVMVDGGSVGAVTSYQFTNVTANHSISASFTINTYTINSSVSGGNGTIAPVGDQLVNYGATPSFTLTPATGYHVYQVTGTCGGTLDGMTFTVNPVTANCTVIASFSATTYTVTSSVLGGNGIIAPEGVQTVNINDTLSFTLTPNTGHRIDQVISTCGGALGGNIFTTNPVTASCTVIGTFAINSYTLHVNFAGQGSGSVISTPSGINNCTTGCSAEFAYGQEVVLKASADESSKFMGWSGEGCTGKGDCTVILDQAREITATFGNAFNWNLFLPVIIIHAN